MNIYRSMIFKYSTISVVCLFFLSSITFSQDENKENGAIFEMNINRKPMSNNGNYMSYSQMSDYAKENIIRAGVNKSEDAIRKDTDQWQHWLTENEYNAFIEQEDFEIVNLKYMSDGNIVRGYILKPVKIDEKKLPVIIYNREGGYFDSSCLTLGEVVKWYELAQKGYLIASADYRGSCDSQEIGEQKSYDIKDILNLLKALQSFSYADMQNIFMVGFGLGGMMTYEVIKSGLSIKAAAVIHGYSDLEKITKENAHIQKLFRTEGQTNGMEETGRLSFSNIYVNRSAIYWPEQINVPVLILQGGDDPKSIRESNIQLAEKLKKAGKKSELVVYLTDSGYLPYNQKDSWNKITAWFDKYKK
ncbi:MAG: prolyl oligopeptidase family serine peptidase [Bacteroidota bacterium]|nr:prolyl oligopeptidase family serine peptidase [Bacteroidota bacterium]